MKRPADPQPALPGMAPEPAPPRYQTTMVDAMPQPWECSCGDRSYAPRCRSCNAPKPTAVDGAAAEGGAS